MDSHCYTVILSYDPENLETHHKVIDGIFRLNPQAAKHFEKANATGRIILKRDADEATARRLKKIFHDSGARCDIQKDSNVSAHSDRRNPGSADRVDITHRKTASRLMTCSNCAHQQTQDLECHNCGIIISKVRARMGSGQRPEMSLGKRPSHPLGQSSTMNAVHTKLFLIPMLLSKLHHYIGTEKWTGWAQNVTDRLIRCGLVFVIALLLEIGLAIFLKMSWFLLIETAAGQHFIETNPKQAESIQIIVDVDPLVLGWDITLTILWIGLALGCVAQLLHLFRYLYVSQPLIGKLVLWFAPFIGFAAWYVGQQEPYPEMVLAGTMVAVPALCLLSSCLHLSQAILPEIGEFSKIFAIILENGGKAWAHQIKKIRNRLHIRL